MRIPLGPFDLVQKLAKGGMGEVWAAEHRAQHVEVAIKVITADFARHPGFQASLRQEVRAMATLSHPSIVRVLDQGEVDGAAARGSDYQLVEGSPYIAMELVDANTLASHVLALAWEDVRNILIKLLGALAHAHARNVLHRDLKPANVLLTKGGTTWHIKLTDFGIAHPVHATERTGPRVAGTPHFMAPEQRRGDWRSYHPATDLFAVGRIASALLKRDEAGTALVPEGFNAWMARSLAATPQHRWAFAADAAWALRRLGPACEPLDDAFEPGRSAISVQTTRNQKTFTFVDGDDLNRPLCTTTFDHAERPDFPKSWRAPMPKPPTRQFKNAGAGLFGIRSIELVGRVAERNKLWQLLHQVREASHVHVLLIRGPEGIGKASLLNWLGERAHELGGSQPMHAAFSPVPGEADPLAAMIANEMNTLGMSKDEAAPRIRELAALFGETDPYDIEALIELANPASQRTRNAFRFSSTEERHIALSRYLRWSASRRAVIVHFEDVQWGPEALRLIRVALELDEDREAPILFALSIDEDALATCPVERDLLDDIKRRAGDRVVEIMLDPLPPTDQRALVESLLGLDPQLVARTAEQTEGNPLHAVQLVTRWHEAGMLLEGPDGLDLAEGVALGSSSVEDLWLHRLESLLEDRPPNDRIAVELLAVLGREVAAVDWQRLARRAGFQPSGSLVDLLIEHGMVRQGPKQTYGFAHASLRQAVLDESENAGRLRQHHQNCADLVKRYALGPDRDGRVGEHLFFGGRAQAALHYLHRGTEAALIEGDGQRARELLALWHRAIESLKLPPTDPRHGDGILLESKLALTTYDYGGANRQAERLRQRARVHGWTRHEAQALSLIGRNHVAQGNFTEALQTLTEASEAALRARDTHTEADAVFEIAKVRRRRGEPTQAAQAIARARKLYISDRDKHGETRCLLASAHIAKDAGRPDEALALADAARQIAQECGSRASQADSLTLAGEVHHAEGRLPLAEKAYRLAIRMHRSTGGPNRSIVSEMSVAQLLQERGEHEQALEILGACIERLHKTGRRGFEANGHTFMLPSLAKAGNRIAFGRHLSAAQALLQETGQRDESALNAIAVAISLAREQGWKVEAKLASALLQSLKAGKA